MLALTLILTALVATTTAVPAHGVLARRWDECWTVCGGPVTPGGTRVCCSHDNQIYQFTCGEIEMTLCPTGDCVPQGLYHCK